MAGVSKAGVEGLFTPILTLTTPLDTTAPAAPAGLTVQTGPGKVARLTWTPPADDDVAEYRIYRKVGNTPGDSTGAELIAEEAGATHIDTTGEYDQTYTWFIRAVDRSENLSGYSNGASATIPATTPDISAPESLAGINLTFGDDTLYQDAQGNWFVRVTINLTGIPVMANGHTCRSSTRSMVIRTTTWMTRSQ